jgi:hypothetical protein
MTELVNASTNAHPTLEVVPLLRRAASIFGAHFDRPGGLVLAADVFDLAEQLRARRQLSAAEWLCRLAADRADRDAQYALATLYDVDDAEKYLQLAAVGGHASAQWDLFCTDPSRGDCLEGAAAAGVQAAVLRLAAERHPPSVVPWLLRLQARGVAEATDRLFDVLDHLSPQNAIAQARLWLPRDPAQALACYRVGARGLGHDFGLYRAILLACNRGYPEPAGASAKSLRAELARGGTARGADRGPRGEGLRPRGGRPGGIGAARAGGDLQRGRGGERRSRIRVRPRPRPRDAGPDGLVALGGGSADRAPAERVPARRGPEARGDRAADAR